MNPWFTNWMSFCIFLSFLVSLIMSGRDRALEYGGKFKKHTPTSLIPLPIHLEYCPLLVDDVRGNSPFCSFHNLVPNILVSKFYTISPYWPPSCMFKDADQWLMISHDSALRPTYQIVSKAPQTKVYRKGLQIQLIIASLDDHAPEWLFSPS